MSDGNFNRALLPHTPYHSGLATGRMQMRIQAEQALKEIIEMYYPETGTHEKEEILKRFCSILTNKK